MILVTLHINFFGEQKKLYNNQQETIDVCSDFGDTTLNNNELTEYFFAVSLFGVALCRLSLHPRLTDG